MKGKRFWGILGFPFFYVQTFPAVSYCPAAEAGCLLMISKIRYTIIKTYSQKNNQQSFGKYINFIVYLIIQLSLAFRKPGCVLMEANLHLKKLHKKKATISDCLSLIYVTKHYKSEGKPIPP